MAQQVAEPGFLRWWRELLEETKGKTVPQRRRERNQLTEEARSMREIVCEARVIVGAGACSTKCYSKSALFVSCQE